ncbi:MAG: zinc ribbon domain-containing protein [Dorea sp.]|nr:zinc ribbon domain-containing protein [Dorea sp.]
MNARSKADFINSVAGGMIPCPNCQKLNEPDSKFCEACGTRLVKPEEPKPEATPAFEPVKKEEPVPAFEPVKKVEPAPAFEPVKKVEPAPAFEPVKKVEPAPAFEPVKKEEPAPAFEPVKKTEIKQEVVYHEPESVFAKGLPDWDMVPPQVMVRRKKR